MQKSVIAALVGAASTKHLVSRNKLEPFRQINYSITSWVSND
jgi:hypothetical protein